MGAILLLFGLVACGRIDASNPFDPATPAASRAAAAVRGRVVLDRQGSALSVESAFVELRSAAEGGAANAQRHPDANGRFAFDDLSDGAWFLRASAEGFQDELRPIELGIGETFDVGDIVLRDAATSDEGAPFRATVRLRGRPDHAGSRVTLRLAGDSRLYASGVTDAAGLVEMPAARNARYTMSVERPGWADPITSPVYAWHAAEGAAADVPDGGHFGPEGDPTTPIERTLEPTRDASIRVLFDVAPDWLPADEQWAQLRLVGPGTVKTIARWDAGLPATFADLALGSYLVTVERPGFTQVDVLVDLIESGVTEEVTAAEPLRLTQLAAARVNLAGVALDACDLRGIDVAGADLRNTTLSGDFSIEGCSHCPATDGGADCLAFDFSGTNLTDTRFEPRTSFEGVAMRGASLAGVRAPGLNLVGADLTLANFSGADLGCPVDQVRLSDGAGACRLETCAAPAALNSAILAGAVFNGANLAGANFSVPSLVLGNSPDFVPCGSEGEDNQALTTVVDLRGANFANADLSGANLAGADFTQTQVAGAILRGTCLSYACFRDTALTLVDLTGASLDRIDATGAEFTSSILSGVSARGAHLDDANLTGAVLESADLRAPDDCEPQPWRDADGGEAYTSRCSGPAGSGDPACCRTTARGAQFIGAVFAGTALDDADLSNANFVGSTFAAANVPPAEQPPECHPEFYQRCLDGFLTLIECDSNWLRFQFLIDGNIASRFCEELSHRQPDEADAALRSSFGFGLEELECAQRARAERGCEDVECGLGSGGVGTMRNVDACIWGATQDCGVALSPRPPRVCDWNTIAAGTCPREDLPAVCRTTPPTARRARWNAANLRALDLGELRAAGALFDGADLTAASLTQAELHGASFMSAKARGIDLVATVVDSADFRRADLSFARLDGSDLGRAVPVALDGADLSFASLAGTILFGSVEHGAPTLAQITAAAGLGALPTIIFPSGDWSGMVLSGTAESLVFFCNSPESDHLSTRDRPLEVFSSNLTIGQMAFINCDLSGMMMDDHADEVHHVSMLHNRLEGASLTFDGRVSLALRGNHFIGGTVRLPNVVEGTTRLSDAWLRSTGLEDIGVAFSRVDDRAAILSGFTGIAIHENHFERSALGIYTGDTLAGASFAPSEELAANRLDDCRLQLPNLPVGRTPITGGSLMDFGAGVQGSLRDVCFGGADDEGWPLFPDERGFAVGDWHGVRIEHSSLNGDEPVACDFTMPAFAAEPPDFSDADLVGVTYERKPDEWGDLGTVPRLPGARFDRAMLDITIEHDVDDLQSFVDVRVERTQARFEARYGVFAGNFGAGAPPWAPTGPIAFRASVVDAFALPGMGLVSEWSCLRADFGQGWSAAPTIRWSRVSGELSVTQHPTDGAYAGVVPVFVGADLGASDDHGFASTEGDLRGAIFAVSPSSPAEHPASIEYEAGVYGTRVAGRYFHDADFSGADLRGLCDLEAAVLGNGLTFAGAKMCRAQFDFLSQHPNIDEAALNGVSIDSDCLPVRCPHLDALCEQLPDTCLPGELTCDGGRCVPAGLVCDGRRDCLDATDEADCACDPATSFACIGGGCIPAGGRCDGGVQCADGSDEQECDQCLHGLTLCQGLCVRGWECNGDFTSAEVGCRASGAYGIISEECGLCGDAVTRIPSVWIGDGRFDCDDGSDEIGQADAILACDDRLRCDRPIVGVAPDFSDDPGDPQYFDGCFFSFQRCDGHNDCADGSDEVACPAPENKACDEEQFRCTDGNCIQGSYRCDGGRPDCVDGSDEVGCPGP